MKTHVRAHSRSQNLSEDANLRRAEMRDFENMKDTAELNALSKYSLEHPLTDAQYDKMMKLAEKLGIQPGRVPTSTTSRREKLRKVLDSGVSFNTIAKGAAQEGKEHPEFTDEQVYEIALDHLLEDKNAY